jgi:hypothetical protein
MNKIKMWVISGILIFPIVFPSSIQAQNPQLPVTAACYFDTIAAQNIEKFAACFETNAVVIDVDREIKGRDAIKTWAKNEVIGGKYTILEVKEIKDGASILLRFSPNGVGDGFRARYVVTWKNNKIIKMDLQYA